MSVNDLALFIHTLEELKKQSLKMSSQIQLCIEQSRRAKTDQHTNQELEIIKLQFHDLRDRIILLANEYDV